MKDPWEEYLSALLGAWRESLASGTTYEIPLSVFLIMLGLTFVVRRRLSVRTLTCSALATIVLYHVNFALWPFALQAIDGFKALYASSQLPALPGQTWTLLPGWALTLIAIAAFDLADYWNHRWMHHPLLWPIHAIHHSDPDVNPFTTYRVHVLEPVFMRFTHVLLLGWLNMPADAIGFAGVFLLLHNMYVHADLDWNHGPFALLLASPRFHRWHHADVPEAYGQNLANVFPLYDRLFGTYYCPGPCRAPLGSQEIPANNPLQHVLYPFARWIHGLRLSAAAGFRLARRNLPGSAAPHAPVA